MRTWNRVENNEIGFGFGLLPRSADVRSSESNGPRTNPLGPWIKRNTSSAPMSAAFILVSTSPLLYTSATNAIKVPAVNKLVTIYN